MTNRFFFLTGFVTLSLLLTSTLSTDIIVRYADHLSLLAFLPSAGIGCYCILDYLHTYYMNTRHYHASQEEIHRVLRQVQVRGVQFKALCSDNTVMLIPNNLPLHQTADPSQHHNVYVLKLTVDNKRKVIHCDDRFFRTSDAMTIDVLKRSFTHPIRCVYSKFNLINQQDEPVALSSNIVRQQLHVAISGHGWSLRC